jgi:hypothetical protein
MAWKVELDPAAERELDKIDPQHARRILAFLHERVAPLDDRAPLAKRSRVRALASIGNIALVITASLAASRTTLSVSLRCGSETAATCTDEIHSSERVSLNGPPSA